MVVEIIEIFSFLFMKMVARLRIRENIKRKVLWVNIVYILYTLEYTEITVEQSFV